MGLDYFSVLAQTAAMSTLTKPHPAWAVIRQTHARTTRVGSLLSPPVAERLLEPFFTTKPTGTGLGLAIVKRFTEGHDGTVSIEGGPTGGARVTIRLPHATAGATP